MAPRKGAHYPRMQAAARTAWASRSPEAQAAFVQAGKLGRVIAKVERYRDEFTPAQVQRILNLFPVAP